MPEFFLKKIIAQSLGRGGGMNAIERNLRAGLGRTISGQSLTINDIREFGVV
jgi:hypothetical protein